MLNNMRYAWGRGIRETGQALERVGLRLEDDLAFKTFLNRKPLYKLYGKNPPKISKQSFVAPNAAIIGNVEIRPGASVWYGAVLRGDSNRIVVGNGSSIGDNCIVHVSSNKSFREIPNPTIVGNNVVVEPGCVIHACTLLDNCTVGAGSVIADSSIIGEYSYITPGSYVSQDTEVPERQVWGGKPANYIRSLTEEEINDSKKVVEQMGKLGEQHKETQEKTLYQEADYDDKTFYHKFPKE